MPAAACMGLTGRNTATLLHSATVHCSSAMQYHADTLATNAMAAQCQWEHLTFNTRYTLAC